MSDPIPIQDYQYELPPDRIAYYPLPDRDKSKLLVYRKGIIEHNQFNSIGDFIPANAILFFNNTRVIPARLYFTKESGATIEIFLLNPITPSKLIAETMNTTNCCSWHCTIGNQKRWKEQTKLTKSINGITLTAELKSSTDKIVDFTWTPEHLSFAEVISKAGNAPLPPYIKRAAVDEDLTRYQTIYAEHEGAVAASTAGLHFTDSVLANLDKRGFNRDFLTLHVSAGTFQPVKTDNALEHTMHAEQIIVTEQNIRNLLSEDAFILPVGTTSMRTLESLYWYGVKLIDNPKAEFIIQQNDPYKNYKTLPSPTLAFEAIREAMLRRKLKGLIGHTSIYIHPDYEFRACNGLITNFHLPGSTLILLVAAFVGTDWRKIYGSALENNYRFLSYGDSSLLIP